MQHDGEGAHRLTREGDRVHAGERAQGLQARGHVRQTAGVQGARATVVPGVERGEQLADLLPSALAHHEAVRTHAQGLTDQSRQIDLAGAFEIGLTGLQCDMVRVPRPQLRDVFDGDDALIGRDLRQQGRQERRLAGARAAGEQEVRPVADEHAEPAPLPRIEGPARRERIEVGRVYARDADRHGCAQCRHRSEGGVHPDARAEPHIDARRLIVEVSPSDRDERHGELADLTFRGPPVRHAFRPAPSIHEQRVRAVQEHVRHLVVDERREQGECRLAPERLLRSARCSTSPGRARADDESIRHTATVGRGCARRPRGACAPSDPVHKQTPPAAVQEPTAADEEAGALP